MSSKAKALLERRRFTVGFAAGLSVAVVLSAGFAFAAIPNSKTQVLNGCRNAKTGALRVIDAQAGKKCKAGERAISWNVKGATGARGPQGVQGPPGPANTAPPVLNIWAGPGGNNSLTLPPSDISIANTPSAWPIVGAFSVPAGNFSQVETDVTRVTQVGVRCQVTANGTVVLRQTFASVNEDGDQTWTTEVVAPNWSPDDRGFIAVRAEWVVPVETAIVTRCYNPGSSTTLRYVGGATYQTTKYQPLTTDLSPAP